LQHLVEPDHLLDIETVLPTFSRTAWGLDGLDAGMWTADFGQAIAHRAACRYGLRFMG